MKRCGRAARDGRQPSRAAPVRLRGAGPLNLGDLVLGRATQLVGLLATALADRVGDRRGGVLSDLLAALESLLASFLDLFLDVVGDRADALILDLRRRQREADQEADGHSADRQSFIPA